MAKTSKHVEWLSLVEVSGPFLTVSMLDDVFPQGLDAVETPVRQRLRNAYEEWCEAVDENDPKLNELQQEWIRLVLQDFLEYDDTVLVSNSTLKEPFGVRSPDGIGPYEPKWLVADAKQKPKFFIDVLPPKTRMRDERIDNLWKATPLEKMTALCREHDVRTGLLTNGEQWMLVNAPVGSVSSDASWYARLWFQELLTLKAFASLLGVRRCFGPEKESLSALLEESLNRHEEITNTLGEQVKNAVEVLVQRLDQADADRDRQLLPQTPTVLYEACLTVMMRLVFILCAEQRRLLLLDEPIYDQSYAASTLREKLQEAVDQHGEEILEHRFDAWPRLLSLFRMVFGGFETESLRLPALGGALFDPDRFPFLEGRAIGTSWKTTCCTPLPIDNRTVLHLMNALEVLEQGTGALLLSYRSLDVEQIGHVYEGLLEYTVKRLDETTLGLNGTKAAKNPNITLAELESASLDGEETLVALIHERTKKTESTIRKALAAPLESILETRINTVCMGEKKLVQRVKPFGNLLRLNAWDYPVIYGKNSFVVTLGPDRRETGTHYTPKSLTEEIVRTTLEPLVYDGFSDGKPLAECRLKEPHEILSLKICDPAMGSGAFLVQVCRWLGARLVESWDVEKKKGFKITDQGKVVESLGKAEPLSEEPNTRRITAMRLITERCLYGVDVNPLAVELAKLSIWLVTMSNGKPLGFLDHNFRAGDSLLGIHNIEQLMQLTMTPDASTKQQPTLFQQTIKKAVADSFRLREELRSVTVRDIHDIETMNRLNLEAVEKTAKIRKLADAMIADALSAKGNVRATEANLDVLQTLADDYLDKDNRRVSEDIDAQTAVGLAIDLPPEKLRRMPFHWAIEFPEVFSNSGGFDAIVGNPPFIGGQRITGAMGTTYRDWLVAWIAEGTKGSADLVAYFFLRVHSLLRKNGAFGLLAVNTIAEGDTRQVGLERLLEKQASIFAAFPNEPWPGSAAVVTSRVHLFKGTWNAPYILSGNKVDTISAFLSDQDEWTPQRLKANAGKSFQGSIVLGLGFTMSEEEAKAFIDKDPKYAAVLFPYLNGEDLNTHPEQKESRWVINFWDWPLERVQKEYPDLLAIVEENVKPDRIINNDKIAREKWWLYLRPRPELYHAIGRGHAFEKHPEGWKDKAKPMKHVLLIARVSKMLAPVIADNRFVFSDATVVFVFRHFGDFTLLQSCCHEAWCRKMASSLETRLRYTPSDVFETFPLPESLDGLESIGESYHELRASIMREEWIGLTKLYNRFHDRDETDERIKTLRELHRQMDEAVAAAYGWDDLKLKHGFHEVGYLPANDRIRFTISEKARREVLRRLTRLNQSRHDDETKPIHVGGTKPIKSQSPKKEFLPSLIKMPNTKKTKIDNALVKNFRGIRAIRIEFHDYMNVFIGVNGSGKSSILDILAVVFSHSQLLSDGKLLNLEPKDILQEADTVEVKLECYAVDTQVQIEYRYSENGFASKTSCSKPNLLEERRKTINIGKDRGLDYPVVVYYPSKRAIQTTNATFGLRPVTSQLDALEGALTSSPDFRSFFARYSEAAGSVTNIDEIVGENDFYIRWYKSLIEAIKNSVQDITSQHYSLRARAKTFEMVIDKDEKSFDVSQLSDGEKNLISLAGDLALRLAIANPSLENPLEGEGIVLIDEVDLHLHPQWQRMILPKLMETFPNCQFIVSTHSPQILGEIKNDMGKIICLQDGENGVEIRSDGVNAFGQTSDVILADIMGTPKRNEDVSKMLDDLFKAIDSGDLAQARQLKNRLEEIAQGIPEFAKIELLIHRKEKLGK